MVTDSRRRRGSRGQGIVEFALVLPVLLLILLFALDFGRAFFGYVILNNAARMGANYAASNPTASWDEASAYGKLIRADTNGANCTLESLPAPVFADGPDAGSTSTDMSDTATVGLTCLFQPLTPFIRDYLGASVRLSAAAAFPVKAGSITGAALPPAPPPPSLDCPVPNLVGQRKNDAADLWSDAGFTGSVTEVGGNGNWLIGSQSPSSGTIACSSGVTVYEG